MKTGQKQGLPPAHPRTQAVRGQGALGEAAAAVFCPYHIGPRGYRSREVLVCEHRKPQEHLQSIFKRQRTWDVIYSHQFQHNS